MLVLRRACGGHGLSHPVAHGAPVASGSAPWSPYDQAGAFMVFRDRPTPATGLFPGMFELHEEAMRRRRAAGTQPWNWNTGLASPPLVATP